MHLSRVSKEHLTEMMTWFDSEHQVEDWAGPNFRYPYDLDTFTEDIRLDSLDSFALFDNEANLVAFGQCYQRLNRCHLGRLAVAPEQRGNNIIAELMTRLIDFGTEKFNASSSSLFVMEHNSAAISAYKKFGFESTDYPEPIPFENCLYMIKGA